MPSGGLAFHAFGGAVVNVQCFSIRSYFWTLRDIDLILVPTHGYGPFRRFLFGSGCTLFHAVEPTRRTSAMQIRTRVLNEE
jgi:hypothetical protein